MDALTRSEQNLVENFISITNYPHDASSAIPLLQEQRWNLERSIIAYFERNPEANEQLNGNSRRTAFPGSFLGEEIDNANGPSNSSNSSPHRPSALTSLFNGIRDKIQSWGHSNGQYLPISTNEFSNPRGFLELSTRNKLIYVIQILLFMPILVLYKFIGIFFLILSKIFPIVRRITTKYSQNRHSSKSEPKGVDPIHTARNFISDFNTYHRNDNRVDFFEGGYTAALYIAKRDARFLAVYLHSDEHDETKEFVNGTLLDERTLKFFQDHNILIWGGDVHESEAYQVANGLNATKFPYLALLCLKTNTTETPEGTTTSAPTLTCVAKVQGLVSPAKLIDKFSSQIERLEPTLINIRTERQQQELSRVIREQQDQAYQASLQRDQEIQERRRQQALLDANRERYLKWRLATLLPEVDASAKGEYARVAIRLATGERISRRFNKNAKLEEVYAYVELYQKGLLSTRVEEVSKPENFVYTYQFNLISPMPRQELQASLETSVKDEPIIWPNGNLIVEEINNE